LGRELRCQRNLAGRGIGGDELDLIDSDGRILVVADGFFDMPGEVLGFGASQGKGAHQPGKVLERDFAGKHDAGKPGGIQQLCEAALRLSRFERYAIKKKFVVGDAEQKASVAVFGQRLLEFLPCTFELTFRALVSHAVQPGVLHQNIEAVQERPSGRAAADIGWDRVGDNSLLTIRVFELRLSAREI
jgi:hypothetical protein